MDWLLVDGCYLAAAKLINNTLLNFVFRLLTSIILGTVINCVLTLWIGAAIIDISLLVNIALKNSGITG